MISVLNKENKSKFFQFLSEHWHKEHIYIQDKKYFDYEISQGSNFLLWIEKEEVVSSLGYLMYSNQKDIFTIIWKNISKGNKGIILLQYLLTLSFHSISSCGIAKNTIPIYQFLEIPTGRLKHFYRLNNNIKYFNIARITKKPIYLELDIDFKDYSIQNCQSIDELLSQVDYQSFKQYGIFKSPEYFDKRYFKHPYYQYHVLCLKESVLVYRVVECHQYRCLRIIDFLGKEQDFIYYATYLTNVMEEQGYEYIDIYEFGLEDSTLIQSGFTERLEQDTNIIPNYFEPFVQENKEIYFMSNYQGTLRMFKGDGDQDRPSIVR